MAERQAARADGHAQPRILGADPGPRRPLFCRRAIDQRAAAAGAHPGFQQSLLARVRPRVGIWRIYDVSTRPRCRRAARSTASCASGIRRSSGCGRARLGADRAQLHPDRIHDQLSRGSREGEVRHPSRARPDRGTTGHRPKGWLSSSLRCTVNTSDICKELGLTYHCDYMNDEQPYLIKTAHGPMVSTPYTQEANDIGMFLRRNLTGERSVRDCGKRSRRALPRRREKRPHDEHRPASAHHRPCLPDPRHPRIPRLREEVGRRVVDHSRGDRGLVSEKSFGATSDSLPPITKIAVP